MHTIARELNPEGFNRRVSRHTIHRGAVVTPGPNYAWSLDGYCKLELVGIQIYAAVDVYSRHVMWAYVGISGRTAVSVLAQYLSTARDSSVIPLFLRTDRGVETPLAADAHYHLSSVSRPRDDGEPLGFTDCFKFGTSKQNPRIETWWAQLSKSATHRWRDFFVKLVHESEYLPDALSDRIALFAIYIPILRKTVAEFVHLWNMHLVRSQRERNSYLVTGIPHVLYHFPEDSGGEHCGITPDERALNELLQRPDMQSFDIDEYLPVHTLHWCNEFLVGRGFDLEVMDTSFNEDGVRVHKLAYIALRDGLRQHAFAGQLPILTESTRPTQRGAPAGVSRAYQDVCGRAGLDIVAAE